MLNCQTGTGEEKTPETSVLCLTYTQRMTFVSPAPFFFSVPSHFVQRECPMMDVLSLGPWGAMKVPCVWIHYHLERDLGTGLFVPQPWTVITLFTNSQRNLFNNMMWDKGEGSLYCTLYWICAGLHGLNSHNIKTLRAAQNVNSCFLCDTVDGLVIHYDHFFLNSFSCCCVIGFTISQARYNIQTKENSHKQSSKYIWINTVNR